MKSLAGAAEEPLVDAVAAAAVAAARPPDGACTDDETSQVALTLGFAAAAAGREPAEFDVDVGNAELDDADVWVAGDVSGRTGKAGAPAWLGPMVVAAVVPVESAN